MSLRGFRRVKKLRTSRRRFLELAAATGVATSAAGISGRALAARNAAAQAADVGVGDATVQAADVGVARWDSRIRIEFDAQMRTRIWNTHASDVHAGVAATGGRGIPLTHWSASDALVLANAPRLDRFELRDHTKQDTNGPL